MNVVDINPNISIVTLNINGLKASIKRQIDMPRVDLKTKPNSTLSTSNPIKIQKYIQMKS